MVSCKHCSTQNSLDSTFCKRCGTSLSEEALLEAQAKLDALIEEGNNLFNLGRTEDAMAVADACVQSNPASVAALALKGLCHERKHEIAEALECAERIVELNPDSELDKIKRNALRTRLQADLRVPEAPNRGLALVGAVAAVVLVACLGVGIARITSKSSDQPLVVQRDPGTAQLTSNELTNPGTALTNPGTGNSNPGTSSANTGGNPTTNPSTPVNDNLNHQAGIGDVPPVGQSNRGDRRATEPITIPNYSGSGLPNPATNGGEVPPVNLGDLKVEREKPAVPTPTQNSDQGNDPTPIGQDNHATPPITEPAKDPSEGIQIELKSRGASRTGRAPSGSEPVSGNGLETLQRVGSQQYQLGNYGGAARSYEQAVQAGGDKIILNQRLGQAYERLGRSSDAAEAYRRCIAACDAAIANGSGNRARHESVKATAEQALKVLQGG